MDKVQDLQWVFTAEQFLLLKKRLEDWDLYLKNLDANIVLYIAKMLIKMDIDVQSFACTCKRWNEIIRKNRIQLVRQYVMQRIANYEKLNVSLFKMLQRVDLKRYNKQNFHDTDVDEKGNIMYRLWDNYYCKPNKGYIIQLIGDDLFCPSEERVDVKYVKFHVDGTIESGTYFASKSHYYFEPHRIESNDYCGRVKTTYEPPIKKRKKNDISH